MPNGLPQRVQSAGSSSLRTRGLRAAGVKSSRGSSRITLLGAGALAQAALDAGILEEAQHRPVGVVEQGPGRAGADAGEAQRAAADVDLERAERRPCRQRHEVGRRRRGGVQVVQRQAHQRPLAAHRQEVAARQRRPRAAGPRGPPRARPVVLDEQLQPAAAMAQPVSAARTWPSVASRPASSSRFAGGTSTTSVAGTVGQGSREQLEAELGDLRHRERQHPRRQAAPEPRHGAISSSPWRSSWTSSTGARPRRRGRCRAACAAARAGSWAAGGVGRGPGRAHARAGAAAGADVGVDRDMVAVGRDRTGRALLEAARAARPPRAGMRAELGRERDVARLLELADQLHRVEQRALHVGGVPWVGPQVAVALGVRREQRRAAGEVHHQVGLELARLLAGAQAQKLARRRASRCQPAHPEPERAQMPAAWRTGPARIGNATPAAAAAPVGTRSRVTASRGELPGGRERHLAVAEHQAAALGLMRHGRRRRRRAQRPRPAGPRSSGLPAPPPPTSRPAREC